MLTSFASPREPVDFYRFTAFSSRPPTTTKGRDASTDDTHPFPYISSRVMTTSPPLSTPAEG